MLSIRVADCEEILLGHVMVGNKFRFEISLMKLWVSVCCIPFSRSKLWSILITISGINLLPMFLALWMMPLKLLLNCSILVLGGLYILPNIIFFPIFADNFKEDRFCKSSWNTSKSFLLLCNMPSLSSI